jgi:transcriptional regulator with XRE-family HTH domain
MEVIHLNANNIPSIGTILYKIREAHNIKQTDLADRLKKDSSQLSQMEHSHKIPNLISLVEYLEGIGHGWKLCIVRSEPEDEDPQFNK